MGGLPFSTFTGPSTYSSGRISVDLAIASQSLGFSRQVNDSSSLSTIAPRRIILTLYLAEMHGHTSPSFPFATSAACRRALTPLARPYIYPSRSHSCKYV